MAKRFIGKDLRRKINNRKIGVLVNSKDIRNELMLKNIGSYPMVNESLSNDIGKKSEFYSENNNVVTTMGKGGLINKSHNDEDEFGKKINSRYSFDIKNSDFYTSSEVPPMYLPWQGKFKKEYNNSLDKDYSNYLEYLAYIQGYKVTTLNILSKVLGFDKIANSIKSAYDRDENITIREALNHFLSYSDIKSAMESEQVGVIRNIDVYSALNGYVNTNINNLNGTDTRLGLITNIMFSNTLRDAAQFNSLRGGKEITHELSEVYGNKLSNLQSLPFLTKIDRLTGRLANEVGEGYGIRHINDVKHGSMFDNMSDFERSTEYPIYKESYDSDSARYASILENHNLGFNTPFNKYNQIDFLAYGYDKPIQGFLDSTGTARNGAMTKHTFKSWSENGKDILNHMDRDIYSSLDGDKLASGLMKKTYQMFTDGMPIDNDKSVKIDTTIARFHTSGSMDKTHNEATNTQTAVTKYGLSHGRNLLTRKGYYEDIETTDKINGYDNPYCRVWTYHHQYSTPGDLIRPFNLEDGPMDINSLQNGWEDFSRRPGGVSHLNNNTVLNRNGFVNITPTSEIDTTNNVDIKKCMFSIENLAWKDVLKTAKFKGNDSQSSSPTLSKEQIGPMGGRIMWFPPYNISFNEVVNTNWEGTPFIGRGEKVYTYTNTERSGTLSFTLLIDHPSLLNYWKMDKRGTENDEQELLRFFAGCDTLRVNNKLFKKNKEKEKINPIHIPDINLDEYYIDESSKEPSETANPLTKNVVFYTFFPNYLSGVDNPLETMKYLICGKNYEIPTDGSGIGYEMSNNGITTKDRIEGTTDKGYLNKKWQYLIDSDYQDRNLFDKNYYDLASFSLNSSVESVKSNGLEDATCSFSDIYNKNVEELNESDKKNLKITKITMCGMASSHGYHNENNTLAKNRRDSILKLLNNNYSNIIKKETEIIPEDPQEINVKTEDKNNVSGISAKIGRAVKTVIEITYDEAITDGNEMEGTDENGKGGDIKFDEPGITKMMGEYEKSLNSSTLSYNSSSNGEKNNDYFVEQERKEKDRKEYLSQLIPFSLDLLRRRSNEYGKTNVVEAVKEPVEEFYDSNTRYEEEAEFFTNLKENDPMLHKRIVDKVKYFDPAYHSMTPEGFNARLTFLHQCTRQGHTIGSSDNNWASNSAGNLAFGRPPVCVLRIGDFFHTKIIINSLTINYDPLMWDTNSEGIGMQPMMANISLNFVFIGGSDIEAPISRLQNAVSFNYYANTSVYDNRADMGEFDNEKKEAKIKGNPWTPIADTF